MAGPSLASGKNLKPKVAPHKIGFAKSGPAAPLTAAGGDQSPPIQPRSNQPIRTKPFKLNGLACARLKEALRINIHRYPDTSQRPGRRLQHSAQKPL